MSERILIALDYPGRRDESRIRDMALEADGWHVRYPLASPLPTGLTAAAYVAQLLAAGEGLGDEVAAVLAYCSGAPLAQEMVARHTDRPVPLLLFDGEPSLLSGLRRDAAAAAAQFGVSTEQAQSGPVADMTDELLRENPSGCFERLRGWLLELGMRALKADGADDVEAHQTSADIGSFYLDWFVFLIAAHNTTWPAFDGDLHHIVSREHPFRGPWPGASHVHVTPIEAIRNELLSAPQTRATVLVALGRLTTHV